MGDQITVSRMTFLHRLFEQIGQLFDTPFKWDNTFIAGGFLSGLMEAKYEPELYKESDIDMYICANTLGNLVTRMQEVIEHIKTHTPMFTSSLLDIVESCSLIV